jgi:hypothetical protein
LSFLRHKKIYQSDGLKRELNCSFSSLTDHRSDESSTGYSFMSCSPAELMSASPVLQSFSLNLAAVKSAAANHNCPYYSLSQPRGPLQTDLSLSQDKFREISWTDLSLSQKPNSALTLSVAPFSQGVGSVCRVRLSTKLRDQSCCVAKAGASN